VYIINGKLILTSIIMASDVNKATTPKAKAKVKVKAKATTCKAFYHCR